MRIIGLCGAAGSGKDTVAGMIAELVPGAKRQGFADALKQSAARLFLPEASIEEGVQFCNTLKAPEAVVGWAPIEGAQAILISGRQFLQRYGTESHRDVFGQDFWLDAVLPDGRDDCELLLIPDMRFENEAERVVDRGGEVWKIVRPEVSPVEAHVSEAGIPADYIAQELLNYGTLEELRTIVTANLAAFDTQIHRLPRCSECGAPIEGRCDHCGLEF